MAYQLVSSFVSQSQLVNYTSSLVLRLFCPSAPAQISYPLICSCKQGTGSCERVWPCFSNKEFRSSVYFYESRPLPKQISTPAHYTAIDIWPVCNLVTATANPYLSITSCMMLNPCPASCWYSRKRKEKKGLKMALNLIH